MNEMQKANGGAMVVAQPQNQVGFNFFDPEQFNTMQRVCKLFANSELVPDMYKVKYEQIPVGADENTINAIKFKNQIAEHKAVANCMIAIEIATRIGASPLMVMQNMTPIYGKPSWSSKFLIATVNTCGRFEPLQFRFTDKGMCGMVDYTDYVWDNASRSKKPVAKQFDGKKVMNIECVAYTTKKGSTDVLESSPVSIELAIQEGWYTKNGSKWQTMTKQMLMYRAASFWTSAYAPELSMGMRTVEEQQDIYVDYQDVTANDVETEKANNANKVAIGADLADGQDTTENANVDTETGEIKESTTEAPKAETKPNPGF
jgi:hypothetical protein|nr:MAG TPA: RecT protein [Caudoviricetes sp.]